MYNRVILCEIESNSRNGRPISTMLKKCKKFLNENHELIKCSTCAMINYIQSVKTPFKKDYKTSHCNCCGRKKAVSNKVGKKGISVKRKEFLAVHSQICDCLDYYFPIEEVYFKETIVRLRDYL